MTSFEIPAACDGMRVDRVVAMLAGVSRTTAAGLVGSGHVVVNGRPAASASTRVSTGELLTVEHDDTPPATPMAQADVEVRVVHADADVIVVDKPPGLVVHPGSGRPDGTLVNGLLARFPDLARVGDPYRPGIVHRLDAGTSGLLVVARTLSAYAALVQQLSSRSVDRQYQALVWGVPEARKGLVDAPIGRSARAPTRMAVSAEGRAARTRYEVVEAYSTPADLAFVACRLETGRTHQIRVHLSSIGHPVVGDAAYRGVRDALDVSRPLLHAARLGFVHPASGETVRFESPLPDDFAAVLAGLS